MLNAFTIQFNTLLNGLDPIQLGELEQKAQISSKWSLSLLLSDNDLFINPRFIEPFRLA